MPGKNPLPRAGRSRRAPFLPVLVLLALLSGGCRPSLTPSPQPTPRVLLLQVTSSLLTLQPYFKECAGEQGNLALAVTQSPAAAIDLDQEGVALRWGLSDPPGAHAFEVGREELVVVAHPQNPARQLSLSDLRAIYSGALTHWPGSAEENPVEPWAYPASEDVEEVFVDALLQGAPPAQSAVFTAPDPQAMLEAVGENPAALGFLPRRWLSDGVKEIAVQDLEPEALRRPVLALTKSEPEGPINLWLGCLQGKPVE